MTILTIRLRKAGARMATIIGSLILATASVAQTFPQKPVRVVLPYSAGSGPDSVMRQISEGLSHVWTQPLIVDNKPGANGWLATGEVKRSAPDGTTLLVMDNTHMGLQPLLYQRMPHDPTADFDPVAPVYFATFFIVVAANSPWNSVSDLIAAARAKDGGLTYGTNGVGGGPHLGSAMFEAATNTRMTHVPFKDLPQIYAAVSSGTVDWAFGTAGTAGPLFKAGRVKLLAVAGQARLPQYPDVKTVEESGGPANFELKVWVGLYAPKGTPPATIDQINKDVNVALQDPGLNQRMTSVGFEPWPGSSADLRRAAKSETLRFTEVVKRAHIALD